MNESTHHHAPNEPDVVAQAGMSVPEPAHVTPSLPDGDAAERHAAVCAGAVECLPDLRAFARAIAANRHQADDLVQSAILRALNAADQFTPGTNFKAWIFTILRNVSNNQWRSPVSRHVSLEDTDGYAPVTAPSQDMTLKFCDFRRAFAQLAPHHREALVLVGAHGLGYSEASAVCGCAPGTMKSRVSRARLALRAMMDGGALNLRRRDVTPISAIDLARALQTAIAAETLSMRTTGHSPTKFESVLIPAMAKEQIS